MHKLARKISKLENENKEELEFQKKRYQKKKNQKSKSYKKREKKIEQPKVKDKEERIKFAIEYPDGYPLIRAC